MKQAKRHALSWPGEAREVSYNLTVGRHPLHVLQFVAE